MPGAALTYNPVCPNCGGPLTPVVLGPQTAPWACIPPNGVCARGWWVSELDPAVSALWRHGHGDFGTSPAAVQLVGVRDQEVAAALVRGTSAVPEQLALLAAGTLTTLAADRHLSPAFAALVADAMTQRGI